MKSPTNKITFGTLIPARFWFDEKDVIEIGNEGFGAKGLS
jgi:hypothetical protein